MQGTDQFSACWNLFLTEHLKALFTYIDHVSKVLLGVGFRNLEVEVQRNPFMLSFFLVNELALQMTGYLKID